jgi:hypothetical protein
MHPPSPRRFGLLAITAGLAALVAFAVPAHAQVSILPGQSANLGGTDSGGGPADGSQVTCRIGVFDVPCFFGFSTSFAAPADNTVHATHDALIAIGLGEPHVVTASIFDDFRIPGSPDDYVEVQLSVSYDLHVSLLGSAAYEAAGELSLVVEDVTSGTTQGVGAASLFRQDRSGDQGFTDVTTGREAYQIFAAYGNLELLLRRGRVYRVWFQAEGMGEQFVVGMATATSSATRRALVVHVDEDEVELLAIHDQDVKEQLDRIESKLDGIDQKLALLLRTQLEQTLANDRESRLTVLTDRKTEVCDAAQQSIDTSTSLNYGVKPKMQRMVDTALTYLDSNPKLAIALCQNAYRGAAFRAKL